MTRIEVASVEDLDNGDRILVETEDDQSIGVFNIDGEYFALQNRCLHRDGPVCRGDIDGKLRSEWEKPGEPENRKYDFDTPTITCPLHGWEYEVATGKHVGDESYQLNTYDVVVDGDKIFLELG